MNSKPCSCFLTAWYLLRWYHWKINKTWDGRCQGGLRGLEEAWGAGKAAHLILRMDVWKPLAACVLIAPS